MNLKSLFFFISLITAFILGAYIEHLGLSWYCGRCFWEFMKVEKVDYVDCGPNPLSCRLLVCGKISSSWTNVENGTYNCYLFAYWDKQFAPGEIIAVRWCLIDEFKGIWRIRGAIRFCNTEKCWIAR